MDAWEILTQNSILNTGDAWEHLNNQSGEGGSCETYAVNEPVNFSLTPNNHVFSMNRKGMTFSNSVNKLAFSRSAGGYTITSKQHSFVFNIVEAKD